VSDWLVDWWDGLMRDERTEIDRRFAGRLVSFELLGAMYKPQTVINLQALREQTLKVLGAK